MAWHSPGTIPLLVVNVKVTLQKRAPGLIGEAEAPYGSRPLLQGKIGKQPRGHSRVELEIRLPAGGSAEEFTSLLQWLRSERDLQGRVSAKRQAPQQEELGGAFELISVAVGSGGIATACVTSLASWLSSRRTEQSVSVTVDGKSVEIVRNGTRPVEEAELLRLIKQTLDER